jgi:hypothetical protein
MGKCIIVVLIVTAIWASNTFTMLTAIGMIAILIALLWKVNQEQQQQQQWLQLLIWFMGTVVSSSAMRSISSSLIMHSIDTSDAVKFAKQCSFLLPSRLIGVLWYILSALIIIGSIKFGIRTFKYS